MALNGKSQSINQKRFERPFAGVSRTSFTAELVSQNQTFYFFQSKNTHHGN
jgi:hypothetical protein